MPRPTGWRIGSSSLRAISWRPCLGSGGSTSWSAIRLRRRGGVRVARPGGAAVRAAGGLGGRLSGDGGDRAAAAPGGGSARPRRARPPGDQPHDPRRGAGPLGGRRAMGGRADRQRPRPAAPRGAGAEEASVVTSSRSRVAICARIRLVGRCLGCTMNTIASATNINGIGVCNVRNCFWKVDEISAAEDW